MEALHIAFADHFWLMYGTLAGFVALVFLVEAWIARRKERKATKNKTELGKVPVVYALPPHVGELGKPLLFEDRGCSITPDEIQHSLKQSLPLIMKEYRDNKGISEKLIEDGLKIDWTGMEKTIKKVSDWKEAPDFIVPAQPFIATKIKHEEDGTCTVRHLSAKRRKVTKKKKPAKRKKK